jgi:protein RecA
MAKREVRETVDERSERIGKICKVINAGTFGGENKDAVTWLGSREAVSIERFPSGDPSLDEALGGGWPKGRFIEIYGSESGGKCVTEDTYVWGHNGLMTISEMFSLAGRKTTCTSRVEEHNYGLAGDDVRKMEETTHFTWNNRKPVRKITTANGLELKGTMNQPVKVISSDGVPSWKNMQDVVPGDAVVVVCGMMIDPPSNGYDEDDAALLALVIAEGHVTENRIGFTNSNVGMLETFESLMAKKFGFINIRKYSRANEKTGVVTWEYHCNSKDMVSAFTERYGGGFSGNSGDKYVPYCVRTAQLSAQIEFMRYYFLSEGSSDKTRSRIEMSSKSRVLIRQIQMMAMNIGSFGRIGTKMVDGEVYWRITMDGSAAEIWQDKVSASTLYPEKSVVIQNHTGRTVYGSMRMAKEIIGDCSDSDRELQNILSGSLSGRCGITEAVWSRFSSVRSNYQFGAWATALIGYVDDYFAKGWDADIVSSIEDGGSVPTFDVVKPDHTFWGSGIVCHNTTLALHAIVEHQKKYPDEDCALIDTEYTFDELYASAVGVNTKYLIVHQPDSGEQALNILKLLMQNGVKCIVVDSVAALTTKAELEGDIGDIHVGQQARLMSGALRQLGAVAGNTNSTVFWTNQMRDKIGVTWGEKTTTPAGRALRFYASIRAHICAIGKIKEKINGEEVVVSSRNKVDVKKNKTAPPFRVAEFCISFGHGIDKVAGVLDMAMAMKVVTKKGSWFSFGTQQLAQGRIQVLDLMRKSDDLTQEILSKIEAAKAAGVVPEEEPDVEKVVNKGEDPDAIDGAAEEGAEVQDV